MNPMFERKAVVCCLIDLLNQATDLDLLDDASTLLAAVRALRPQVVEIDVLEASILIKRTQYAEAIRLLRNAEASVSHGATAKASIALCKYMLGDPEWHVSAAEVLESRADPAAVAMVERLQRKSAGVAADTAEAAAPAAPLAPMPELFGLFHVRA